jgi:cyanophycinase
MPKVIFFAVLFFANSFAWSMQIFRTGNPSDIVTQTKQAVCLAGGGDDDAWAAGWKFILNSTGNGDVVVVRADDRRGDYESWIYNDDDRHNFPKVNSVTTLLFEKPMDANNPEAIHILMNAEFVFFAGGDQSTYLNWLKASKFNQAINYLIHVKKISVAGTSAGMAIMGSIDYSARQPSPEDQISNVNSVDVMKNPTGSFVDLDRNFITAPYLANVITDTHFSERNREGRLIGFMARAIDNRYSDVNLKNIRAISADENTAVCYGPNGVAKVFGSGNAFFLKPLRPVERLKANQSLNWYGSGQAIQSYIISGRNQSARFDLKSWTGTDGVNEYWSVDGRNENTPIFKAKLANP